MSATRQFFITHMSEPAVATATLDILCVLPLLSPFALEINIILQSLLVVLTGSLCWLVLLMHRKPLLVLPRYLIVLLALYVGWAFLSLMFNHALINIFGSSFLRLGILPLIACVGCGLLLRIVPSARLLTWIYCSSLANALVSLVSLRSLHIMGRFGGVFHQADILGVWMGCGLVFGLGMWQLYPRWRRLFIVSQSLLLLTMLLSQTRASIILVGLIGLVILLRSQIAVVWKVTTTSAVIVGVALFAVFASHTGLHALNRQDATESVSYRVYLQSYGLRASFHHPLFGYGAGNVTQALNCPSLASLDLQQTCRQGFYFNSSHNIYLDRILALGFIGGIAFLLIILYGIYTGLRTSGIDLYFTYAALIIVLYYLTNVTNTPLELLLWVLLLRPFKIENDEET